MIRAFVEAHEAAQEISGAAEVGKVQRPIAEHALPKARTAMQHRNIAMTGIALDAGEHLVDGALLAFKRLQESAVMEEEHAGDADRLVARPRAGQ